MTDIKQALADGLVNNRINVVTKFNQNLIEQHIEGFSFDDKVKQIIQLREDGVRKALIELGWVPPAEECEPYLKNYADGVDGHYCLARKRPEGYTEFYDNKTDKWCSVGTVFNLGIE